MNFRVGQKVVCVDPPAGYPQIVKGQVYTVAATSNCCRPLIAFELASCACNKCRRHHDGPMWYASRFRPIDDLTASLARTESERLVEERPDHVNVPQTVEK